MYRFAKQPNLARNALLVCCCAALLLSGCMPAAASVATPAPTPGTPDAAVLSTPAAPGKSPMPEPDYAALCANAADAFHAAFAVDFSALMLPDMQYITDLMAQYDAFLAMRKGIDAAVRTAFAEAYAAVCSEYETLPGGRLSVSLPAWQELMSLYRALGPALEDALAQHCAVQVDAGAASVSVSVSFAAEDALAGSSAAKLSYTTLLAYLNTVYDETGAEKDYVDVQLPDAYIATLCDPLPGRRIKDGWYGPRSKNTRKHTGTDIRASADMPILSCTNGTVIAIGTAELSGNYVAVLDDYGYEYHYYHMIRVTDFLSEGDRVEGGDVLGHVGNTGNSDANHLHLAIITPEVAYINPYPVLVAMRAMQKAQKR